jgi:hypothetical protein
VSSRFEVDEASYKRVQKYLSDAPARAFKALSYGMMRAGLGFEGQLVARRLSGHSDHSLGRRSGALARSCRVRIRTGGTLANLNLEFHVGVGAPHAKAHEAPPLGLAGTPIMSTRAGGYLSIPLADDLFSGTMVKRGPREDQPLSPLRMPDGKLFLIRRLGDFWDFRWMLVRSVTLKPRMHLLDDWKKWRKSAMVVLRTALAKEMRRK